MKIGKFIAERRKERGFLQRDIAARLGISEKTVSKWECGNGAGGLTYFVKADDKRYVVKYPSDNEMNNPDVEIRVCKELLEKGIPACRFIPNKQGKMISTDENGRRFTLQYFYEGLRCDEQIPCCGGKVWQ